MFMTIKLLALSIMLLDRLSVLIKLNWKEYK